MKISSENIDQKKKRLNKILKIFAKEYPMATIQLEFENPFQLMVATILSAQCTDERVNKVTEKLFQKYQTPEDFIEVPIEELEKDIFSTGYYKAKSSHIKNASSALIKEFNGIVPNTIEELVKLPGVGRKTANVILGHCFNVPGIVVDTHVSRISSKLGLVSSKNPEKIEFELMDLIPKSKWVIFTHYIISHGRKICKARNPSCEICPIKQYCPSVAK